MNISARIVATHLKNLKALRMNLEKCPKCNGKVQRLIGRGAGIIFKGSGFYATDYAKSNSPVCGRDRPCCGRDAPCDSKPCEP